MTNRKSRRAVFAELLLTTSPMEMGQLGDGTLSIAFETIAQLRTWLDTAGLNTPTLLTSEYTTTREDGRPCRRMVVCPTWHGWRIYAAATDHTDLPSLDAATRDRLTDLAGVA